jgi:cobalamin biosynthesis protein CbiD
MEMIENVARALAPIAWAALGTGDTLAQVSRRTASLRHARAAIEAQRNSAGDVVAAVSKNAGTDLLTVGRVLQAYFDAALASSKEDG